MMKKVKAFTLIETLVVVAIFAILAAMLISAFAARKANLQHLHDGDRVVLLNLDVKGIIDTMNFNEATVIATGTDGFPVKLQHVKLNLLRKY